LSGTEKQTATIGKVLSPHGVAGLVKVFPYSDFPDRCHDLDQITIDLNGRQALIKVEQASVYGRFWLMKLEGVHSREEASRLTGGDVLIPLSERVSLPAGRYYFDQVVGLKVFTAAGERLGDVAEVISTGGHDIYLVRAASKGDAPAREILVPAVRRFVKEIDPDGGRMVVELPEGLSEL
jgi:16S rRNA processing protein RimM